MSSEPTQTQTAHPANRYYCWMLYDALRDASGIAARSQEAAAGTDAALLFEEARKAIVEFTDNHPAMRALADAAIRKML